MKKMRKITALLCAALMIFGSVPTAAADGAAGDAVRPYEIKPGSGAGIEEYVLGDEDIERSFSMMGVSYTEGFTVGARYSDASSEVSYNLEGNYRLFTVDIGHIDNGGTASGSLHVYCDGVLTDTVALDYVMQTVSYTLNVSGVSQLRLMMDPDYDGTAYGFAGARAYTKAESDELGLAVPAVSSTETVMNTPLPMGGECVLPYQNTPGSGAGIDYYKSGDEDIESSFSMMGVAYTDGFTVGARYSDANSDVCFNLGGEFRIFTFDLGHIDNGGTAGGTVYLYCDGVLTDSFGVDYVMQTYRYTLNVSGVNQVRVLFDPDYDGTAYGFANVRAYTKELSSEMGMDVPAVSSTETVMNTPLPMGGECVLPYQNTPGSGAGIDYYKSGDEDVESSFSMMGVAYTDGFTVGARYSDANSDVCFNLGGEFRIFAFDLGHIDNGGRANGSVYIYADGVLIDTVSVDYLMQTKHCILNVSGINALRIAMVPSADGTAYGFANIRAYTKELAEELGITVPAAASYENIKNTSLPTEGEYILPYQTVVGSGSGIDHYKSGDEDVESSFSMMGTAYTDGVTIAASYAHDKSELLYNLGGIFESFSFKLGHIDGAKGSPATFYFYGDGNLLYQVECTSTMQVSDHTIDTKGVNQLYILQTAPSDGIGYALANITAKHTHEWNTEPTIDKAPTCDKDGIQSIHCAGCGNSDPNTVSVVDALGHEWNGEPTVEKAPTCDESGLQSIHCSRCGKADKDTTSAIAPTGHEYADGFCTKCGASEHTPGDINSDGAVNTKDLSRLMKKIAGEAVDATGADVTGDGKVDTKDLTRLMKALSGENVELN